MEGRYCNENVPKSSPFCIFQGLVNKVNNFKPLRLTEIPATHDRQLRSPQLHDGILYHSRNPMRPEVTFNTCVKNFTFNAFLIHA